jgi:sulfatase maturation enzyme AslB (radical SAM superfamily)
MNKTLVEMKKKLLESNPTGNMLDSVNSLGIQKNRPLGKINPHSWWVELTRGCNLKCQFCATRLFERGDFHFMEIDTWKAMLEVVAELTPKTRIEFGNAGEPTLHPRILEFLRMAKEICPTAQILTYTNGTQLVNGKLTYKELFKAGLNVAFVDMYASFEVHRKIAEDSGYEWVKEGEAGENPFQYQNDPDWKYIFLANNPYNWTKKKLARGRLQTFFNDLDWPAASKFGMAPVEVAPARRCDLPSKYVNVNHDGTFVFCCFDYLRHTVSEFGNINGGVPEFLKFWLGEYMQDVRARLDQKDRASHSLCSKCSYSGVRSDIPYWKAGFDQYWDGEKFVELKVYNK